MSIQREREAANLHVLPYIKRQLEFVLHHLVHAPTPALPPVASKKKQNKTKTK